uniref:Reverse transcriptase domain-containing protein n=1 Tax=Haemonchus contortus TaxID=6289 RepID=A0A7I4Y7G6_HAECO
MPPYEEPPTILKSEVANAIRSMKKGTAPGLDNIPADLLRSGNTALHTLLAEHFNHYLKLKRIPEQWKESKTIFLFKKGHREDISNYRPISLLSVVYESFTKILLNRMECTLDEYQPIEQTGFRKNFSCMDNIQAVTQLIERSREYRLPLALLFVDYKKAFDSVEINAVLNALAQAGVDPAYVHLLEQCLSNTSTSIQLFERKLKIPVGKGVRQGDTISPKLFTAALQYAMLNLDWDERGYSVNGRNVNNLRFADDIVLISSSTPEMEKMVSELNAVSRRIGLEMNMSKTQLMVNQWCDTGTVRLDGKAQQRVESYVYLGRELNMMNNITLELNRRRRAAWAAFGSIREVTDQVSDPDLKASIFNASVLPAMCYATETWPNNKSIAKP